jgi:hypothetical protein
MKKILWVSRHPLSQEQMEGLTAYCGEEPQILWYQQTVEALDVLMPAIEQVDVVAAVFPLHLLVQLVALGKPVLISRAIRRLSPSSNGEAQAHFTHNGWFCIKKLELELIPITPVQ